MAGQPKGAVSLKAAVLYLLQQAQDGLTCEELEKMTSSTRQSVSPRIYELIEAGLVEKTALKRQSSKGVGAVVFAVTGNCSKSDYYKELLQLTVQILENVPAKKRGPLAAKVKKLVEAVQ